METFTSRLNETTIFIFSQSFNNNLLCFWDYNFIRCHFFGSRYRQSQKEIAQLIKQKVNGKILSVDDLGRGSISLILLTDSNTRYITTGLPIAWEIEKFEIRKGDSLHKNYNSNKIFFFRKTPNGYVQVGNAEIWR